MMKILILIDNLTNGTLGAKDFHARFRFWSFCRKKKLWYLGKANSLPHLLPFLTVKPIPDRGEERAMFVKLVFRPWSELELGPRR